MKKAYCFLHFLYMAKNIKETISENSSSSETLLNLALIPGGRDNTSIIMLHFEDSL